MISTCRYFDNYYNYFNFIWWPNCVFLFAFVSIKIPWIYKIDDDWDIFLCISYVVVVDVNRPSNLKLICIISSGTRFCILTLTGYHIRVWYWFSKLKSTFCEKIHIPLILSIIYANAKNLSLYDSFFNWQSVHKINV